MELHLIPLYICEMLIQMDHTTAFNISEIHYMVASSLLRKDMAKCNQYFIGEVVGVALILASATKLVKIKEM